MVRHGSYDFDYNLSERGKQEIQRISEDMMRIIGEASNGHYLLSSTASRAEQSAEIIARAFGLDSFEKRDRLWTRGGYDFYKEELEEIDSMIAPHRDGHDVVTVVAHYEVVGSYSSHVVRTLFGRDERIRRPEKGGGVHLNLETQTHQMLPLARD